MPLMGGCRWGGHIVHDGVQQLLHTLVLIGSATGDRHHVVGDGGLADAVLDLVDGELFTGEILVHQIVVQLGHMLHQLGVILLGQLLHVLGDFLAADVLAQVVVVDIGLHLHQVHKALKGVLTADGQLDRDGVALQAVFHHLDDAVEIGAHDVHFCSHRPCGELCIPPPGATQSQTGAPRRPWRRTR